MATGLATRCSACGTVFRVVPDQLRVSEGWVRCGRCAEVFNASETLLDLETGAPHTGRSDAPPRAMAQFSSGRPTAPSPAGLAPPPAPAPAPVVDDTASRFADDASDADTNTHADVDVDSANLAAYAAYADEGGRADRAGEADIDALPQAEITAEPRALPAATPTFMRQAERAARWRRPRVRAALLAGAVLGAVALAAQVVFEYRELAAARFAGARPALEQVCAWVGCTVGPARVIESLQVESSGLVRVEKSEVYKLSLSLRNRAALEVALPAVELSLTDSQGKLVARRVLPMSELGVNQATLAAGRELALTATLQAATAPVAGYTIELFYP